MFSSYNLQSWADCEATAFAAAAAVCSLSGTLAASVAEAEAAAVAAPATTLLDFTVIAADARRDEYQM